MTENEARKLYFEKKARVDELEHAKEASDAILGMFGIPKYGQAPMEFPGLREARAEMKNALDNWSKSIEGC